jgi:hypothetical protein
MKHNIYASDSQQNLKYAKSLSQFKKNASSFSTLPASKIKLQAAIESQKYKNSGKVQQK